jgi:SAM-dependent methyltransferase
MQTDLRPKSIMPDAEQTITFSGEFFVPGQSGNRIEEDHFHRYEFARSFAKGKSILDIACGFGYGGPILMAAGATSYDGVDINEELVSNAKSTYGHTGARYHHGDIRHFSADRPFDLIVCFETIEHLRDYRAALRNLATLLDRNGLLLISSPNRPITSPRARSLHDTPENEFHTQEFTPPELDAELRLAGLLPTKRFGQRPRIHLGNGSAQRILHKLMGDPDSQSSPIPKRYLIRQPRYFITLARKI